MIRVGLLDEDVPLELVGGELVFTEPQGSRHYTAVTLVSDALRAALGSGWFVRAHGPVVLDHESEPEPDVSVVRGTPRDYSDAHPARPVLTVEVSASGSRLTFDRAHKGSLYARADLPDFWIVNLVDEVVEIYRDPIADDASAFGWRFGSREVQRRGEYVSPLAEPSARIEVSSLLP